MYEPFVTEIPQRQADGMVHFAVEFRGEGLPTISRKSFTDSFTEDWFKAWCCLQAENLNRPQEIDSVSLGKVDLEGVAVTPSVDAARQAYADHLLLYARLKKAAEFKPDILDSKQFSDCVTYLNEHFSSEYLDLIRPF